MQRLETVKVLGAGDDVIQILVAKPRKLPLFLGGREGEP